MLQVWSRSMLHKHVHNSDSSMCSWRKYEIYVPPFVLRSRLDHVYSAKVNLWAVAHRGPAPPNARRKASELQQTPVGFEHALSVDLAGLVGATGGSNGRGASQIALLGNLLAVATDHAVFLVHLSFHVKGEF